MKYDSEEIKAYKIVEKHNDDFKTLFHGVNGSKKIPYNKWIAADEKIVRDGSGETTYLSGWHILLKKEEAYEYLKSFTRRLDKLKVVAVKVKNIRPKIHSKSPVFLAKELKLENP